MVCASETKMLNEYILQLLGCCNPEKRSEIRQTGLQGIPGEHVSAATVKSYSKSPSKDRGPRS